jgi:hypothetical protein
MRDALLGTEKTEAEESLCTDLRDTKKMPGGPNQLKGKLNPLMAE